jgi:AcrR family transcriptional regulator
MTIRREEILAEACGLYLTDGLDGFSMRKLARLVGVTAPALYRHYVNKEAVLIDVVGEAYKLFAQYLYRALSAPTPAERFRRAGEEYLNFALEHPKMYEMLYVSSDSLGLEELPEEASAQCAAVGQFWNDRVREAIDVGILRDFDPEAVSTTMWAHAHGLVTIYHRGFIPVDEDEFRRLFHQSAMRIAVGLGSEETARQIEGEMAGAVAPLTA